MFSLQGTSVASSVVACSIRILYKLVKVSHFLQVFAMSRNNTSRLGITFVATTPFSVIIIYFREKKNNTHDEEEWGDHQTLIGFAY